MNTQATNHMRLAEEAAEWVVRRLEDRSGECDAEFLRWLKHSPHHIDEFLLVAATYASLRDAEMAHDVAIVELAREGVSNVVALNKDTTAAPLQEAQKNERTSGGSRARRFAWAASLATVAAASAWMLFAHLGSTYSTGVGEQRMVRLPDGSLMHLNTRSRVKVDYSEETRQLRLIEGEAFFSVAKDGARPFQVLTDEALVQALGTEFNVYDRRGSTRVSVLDGLVQIVARTPDAPPARLGAGEQADIADTGDVVRNHDPDVQTALAWRDRQLIFRAVPLAEVAEQFNRYNEFQLRIEGEALQGKLIWGVFPVDEPQALVKFLAQDESIVLQPRRNGMTARAAR